MRPPLFWSQNYVAGREFCDGFIGGRSANSATPSNWSQNYVAGPEFCDTFVRAARYPNWPGWRPVPGGPAKAWAMPIHS